MSRRLAVVAFIALAIAGSRPAGALVNPCQNAIGRAVVGYSKGRIKVISSCEDRRSKGTVPAAPICRPQCSGGLTPQAPCRAHLDRPRAGPGRRAADPGTA